MFKIYDGRSHFYQWDIDRKLIVEDASISEVHFCNQTDNYSLVCKTYIEDGLNLVNVPNILLQNDWRINVYAYDSNYTKFSEQFDVIRRCKPEDYVYTETEILNYNTLSDRITKIEEGGAGLEPLVGTTQTITPSQVLAAIKEGRDIALQYTDSYYGAFVFSAFNANERLGIVVSNSILPQMDGLTGTLLGFVEDDTWIFKATKTATKDDVGTAVNEALAAAKESGEFDGADGITPTIGENGNWYLGDTDTNKPSRGEKGEKGETGARGEKGADGATGATGADGKSAYSYAQDGGYSGTEAEFAAKLAAEKLPNPYPLTFTGAVSETYDGSSAKTIEIPSGGGAHEGIYSLLVEHTITEDVSEVVYTNEEYPGIANLKHILVSIIFPKKQTTGWWKLLAGDVVIMSTAGVSNAKHYYGAADVKCGHWIWSGAGSSNDSAGQKLSPPSVEFNPRIGFIPTVYNDYSSLRIYGNSFTLTAGTVVRIWGCE